MHESQQMCVYSLTVEAHIISVNSTIKFPCFLCLTWKTNDNKSSAESGRFKAVQGKSEFGQTLTLHTQIAYNKTSNCFLKKETQLQLNLISKSQVEQPKLAGRTTVNIADILNDNRYSTPTDIALQFCSVNASILASFKIINKNISNTPIEDLQSVASSRHSEIYRSTIKQTNNKSRQSNQEDYFMKKSITQSVKITKDNYNAKSIESVQIRQATIIEIKQQSNGIEAVQMAKQFTPQRERVFAKKSIETLSSQKIITSLISNNDDTSNSLRQIQTNAFQEKQKRLLEQLDKIRLEHEQLRKDNEKNRQQSLKSRQQADILKVQIKQKQAVLEQTSSDLISARKQITFVRQQLSAKMKETVQMTLTIASLKDSSNKSNEQIITYERQVHKLQQVKAQFQRSEIAKKQLNLKLSQYQKTIEQLKQQSKNLQKEKNSSSLGLQKLNQSLSTISAKLAKRQEELILNESSFRLQIEQLNKNKDSLQHQIEELNIIVDGQRTAKTALQQQINTLSYEIQQKNKKLEKFISVQKSLSSGHQRLSSDLQAKQKRISQLEQCMINIEQKAANAQNQNKQLQTHLTEHKSRILLLTQEHHNEMNRLQDDMLQTNQQLQQLRLIQCQLIEARDDNASKIIAHQQSNLQLTQQNSVLRQNLNTLTNSYEQLKVKKHQLEELLIKTSEHQNSSLSQAEQQSNQSKLRELELEGEIKRLATLLEGTFQKLGRTQEELTDRQNLIARLQQGLNKQMQHSEGLNRRLISFIMREDRIKDVISQMEAEHGRLTGLLVEQELRQKLSAELNKDKDASITQMVGDFQNKIQQSNFRHQSMLQKESELQQQIEHSIRNISQRQSEIKELKTILNNNNSIITQLRQDIRHTTKKLQDQQINYEERIASCNSAISQREQDKTELKKALSQKQQQLTELQIKLAAKQSELLLVSEERQSLSLEINEIRQLSTLNEENYQKTKLDLEEQCSRLNSRNVQLSNELSLTQSNNQQQIQKLKAQLDELKNKLQTISKDQQSFDIARHRLDMQQKDQTLSQFQQEVKRLQQETQKIQHLERTIKIQSIELNSFKFKGKNEEAQHNDNELLKLKNQQIAVLTRQNHRLQNSEQQMNEFKQQVEALQTELALLEQEKFNIEEIVNQKEQILLQLRQQNKNLTDQIEIIGERNGQFERTINELVNKPTGKNGNPKAQAILKAENILLNNQLREMDALKQRLADIEEDRQKIQQRLQQNDEKHMLDLIDQQIKFKNVQSNHSLAQISIKRSQQNITQSNLNLPNMSLIYTTLKELLQHRQKSKLDQRLRKALEALMVKQPQLGAQFQQKTKSVQRQLKKIKFNLLKRLSDTQEKAKLMAVFKNCEHTLTEIVNLAEEASK